MILSHRAPSSLNMSSYRAIWTHFRPNIIFFTKKSSDPEKSKLFLKCQSPHLAILINICHMWEDGCRKANMNEPDLRFFSRRLLTCYQPGRSKTLSGGVVMGFTFSLKMIGTKILVPRSLGEPVPG